MPESDISKCFFVPGCCHTLNPALVLWNVLNVNWLLDASSMDSELTGMAILLAGYAESQAITGLFLSMSALFLSWPLSSLFSRCGAEQGWYHCCQNWQTVFPSQGHMNRYSLGPGSTLPCSRAESNYLLALSLNMLYSRRNDQEHRYWLALTLSFLNL